MATADRKLTSDELLPADVEQMQSMDPKLQRMVAKRRAGQKKAESSSTGADEVAVIAKVRDLTAWEGLSEVRVGATIGARDADGTWIVTARIPVARIDFIRSQPCVVSLKPAQRTREGLHATLPDIRALAPALPATSGADGGKGVVLGVIDFGCGFAHQNFLASDGKTRLLALWDQTAPRADTQFGYGALYKPAAINAALKKASPYQALGYGPGSGEAAHGTHVLDIAGGNGRGSGNRGVAPQADLVFVELASSDVPDAGEAVVGSNFGDSVQVLEAVKFVFDQAGNRPCVVNLSLGTNGGPHDGSTLVEQGFDRMLREKSNRAIVLAASNSFADGIHASGSVPANGRADVRWQVDASDTTENELEVWYPGARALEAELIAPNGRILGRVAPGKSLRILDARGRVVVFATNRQRDPGNGDNVINVWQSERAPHGLWNVRLHSAAAATPYHAWVERDDDGQSSFPLPRDDSHTLGTFACGQLTLVVGSYDAHKAAKPLSWFSSSGPTRDGRNKPELSAPGHDVRAANSRTRAGITIMSGTSMASPAVAGAVALVLAAARRRGRDLSINELRKLVIESARPMGAAWDPRYGHGRIDVASAIAALRGSARPAKKAASGARAAKKTLKAGAGKTAIKRPRAAAGTRARHSSVRPRVREL